MSAPMPGNPDHVAPGIEPARATGVVRSVWDNWRPKSSTGDYTRGAIANGEATIQTYATAEALDELELLTPAQTARPAPSVDDDGWRNWRSKVVGVRARAARGQS